MRHIAFEGRCYVLSANQFARRGDCPDDYPVETEDPEAVLSRGGSMIASPLGEILAGPELEGEAILRAELDLDQVGEASTTSTSWATTRGPTSSGSRSTSSPRPRSSGRTSPRGSSPGPTADARPRHPAHGAWDTPV
jgi:Carbon-nitrogen hydrolase